jgi:hypothetical protein
LIKYAAARPLSSGQPRSAQIMSGRSSTIPDHYLVLLGQNQWRILSKWTLHFPTLGHEYEVQMKFWRPGDKDLTNSLNSPGFGV